MDFEGIFLGDTLDSFCRLSLSLKSRIVGSTPPKFNAKAPEKWWQRKKKILSYGVPVTFQRRAVKLRGVSLDMFQPKGGYLGWWFPLNPERTVGKYHLVSTVGVFSTHLVIPTTATSQLIGSR